MTTVESPTGWSDRLIKEKAELEERLRKLEAFLANCSRIAIDDRTHDLLRRQRNAMAAYLGVLSARLDDTIAPPDVNVLWPTGSCPPESVLAGARKYSKPPADGIHPPPAEFSREQLGIDPILCFFHYAHLPPALQERSAPFCNLARLIVETTPRNAERTVALRKLLEAKDAAVRAAL